MNTLYDSHYCYCKETMSMRRRLVVPTLLALGMLCLAIHAPATGAPDAAAPQPIDVADPARYWAQQGFVELEPAIRVSKPPGFETSIRLRVPADGRIET